MITKEEAEKLYADLIQLRRSDILIKSKDNPGAIEIHHIIPISCGGLDEDSNKIALYAKEHFMAHVYLYIIHRNMEYHDQMTCALMNMHKGTLNGSRQELRDYILASEEYQLAREDFAKIFSKKSSKINKGKNNPMHGKHWYYNPETNESKPFIEGEQPNEWVLGKPMSNDAKNKCGKSNKGKIWIRNIKTNEAHMFTIEDAEKLIVTGEYVKGGRIYSFEQKEQMRIKSYETKLSHGKIKNPLDKYKRYPFCLNCGKPNDNLYSHCCCDQCTKEYKDKKVKQLIELKRKKEVEQLEKTGFFRAQITELYKGIVDRKQVKRYLEYKGIVKCQHCGKEHMKLIVHSKDNNPKNLALDNYELLCRDCYNKVSTFGYYNYNNIRKQNKEK